MDKRIGQILVTYEVLAKALGLDGEHAITAIVPQDVVDITSERFGVIVRGPRMPLTREGEQVISGFSFAELE
jgi:hypothetical protein